MTLILDLQSGELETKPQFREVESLTTVHGFHQLISQPTPLLPQNSSYIDLLFPDQPNLNLGGSQSTPSIFSPLFSGQAPPFLKYFQPPNTNQPLLQQKCSLNPLSKPYFFNRTFFFSTN